MTQTPPGYPEEGFYRFLMRVAAFELPASALVIPFLGRLSYPISERLATGVGASNGILALLLFFLSFSFVRRNWKFVAYGIGLSVLCLVMAFAVMLRFVTVFDTA